MSGGAWLALWMLSGALGNGILWYLVWLSSPPTDDESRTVFGVLCGFSTLAGMVLGPFILVVAGIAGAIKFSSESHGQ